MLIVYCETCGRRIHDSEIKVGTALQVDENQYHCAKCASGAKTAGAATTLPKIPSGSVLLSEVAVPTNEIKAVKPRSGSRNRRSGITAAAIPPRASGIRHAQEKQEKSSAPDRTLVYAGIAAGVVMLAGGAALMLPSSGSRHVATAVKDERAATAEKDEMKAAPPKTYLNPVPVARQIPTTSAIPVTPADKKAEEPSNTAHAHPASPGTEMENFRETLAGEKLNAAQAWHEKNGSDPWGYAERLNEVVNLYDSTAAAAKAKALVDDLKLPPKPPPPELPTEGSGEWVSIFNGKSSASVRGAGWKLEGNVLVNDPSIDEAAQIGPSHTDVEIRYSFAVGDGLASLSLRALQGAGGSVGLAFNSAQIKALGKDRHEARLVVRAGQALAFLDGKSMPVAKEGNPRRGRIQIRANNGKVFIYTIDYRSLK